MTVVDESVVGCRRRNDEKNTPAKFIGREFQLLGYKRPEGLFDCVFVVIATGASG